MAGSFRSAGTGTLASRVQRRKLTTPTFCTIGTFRASLSLNDQVEYAQKAVDNAGTVIGLRVKDGIVLAVEKLTLSKLLVPGANRRIASVDTHAGVVSGFVRLAWAGMDDPRTAERARAQDGHLKMPSHQHSASFSWRRDLGLMHMRLF